MMAPEAPARQLQPARPKGLWWAPERKIVAKYAAQLTSMIRAKKATKGDDRLHADTGGVHSGLAYDTRARPPRPYLSLALTQPAIMSTAENESVIMAHRSALLLPQEASPPMRQASDPQCTTTQATIEMTAHVGSHADDGSDCMYA